jgi:hypothetical protein
MGKLLSCLDAICGHQAFIFDLYPEQPGNSVRISPLLTLEALAKLLWTRWNASLQWAK